MKIINYLDYDNNVDYSRLSSEYINNFIIQNNRPFYSSVVTYGCQQNEEDSEKLCGYMVEMGMTLTEDINHSDLIVVNTCAIRDHAEKKATGLVGLLKHIKEDNPSLIILFCGCMAQEKHIQIDLCNKYKHVNASFGPQYISDFPHIFYSVVTGESRFILCEDKKAVLDGLPQVRKNKYSCYVTIMTGCNNFCSYCVVPYVRGREISRKSDNILNEIRELVASGYKDITLLGQNVNSYGKDMPSEISFSTLLRKINSIDGEFRVRFMTSHPKDISRDVIDAIADCDKICNHLHLPVQSGNNYILEQMNRKYTREDYLEIINYAKEKISDLVLTTDIIVGFPGETEEMFADTVSLVDTIKYDSLFSFIFSKRKGTPAYDMERQIEYPDKLSRYNTLRKVQERISLGINNSYLGKKVRVLCLEVNTKEPGYLTCRTDGNKIVFLKAPEKYIGKFVTAIITSAKTWFMYGELD